jgi:hypothetical protein
MKPHEIFHAMAPEVAARIFNDLHENERPLYKATIDTLAKQRKLRPVFVERKPRNERNAWLQDALGRKTNEDSAAHILQLWLVKTQSALLCDFLDALGIKHDEHGMVEDLPAAPAHEQLTPVIGTLLGKYDPGVVSVYLHAFNSLNDTPWESLAELLASDARLRMGPPPADFAANPTE